MEKNENIYTYLMTDGLYYKIGKSKHPGARAKEFSTGNAHCELLFYGTGRTEKQLHDLFRSFKVKGEWFKLKHWHVELIHRLLTNTTTGEDLLRCSSLRSAALREKEYDSFVIKFGKYEGRLMSTMNSPEEIKYLEWVQTWRKIDVSHPALLRAINMHLKKHIKQTA